MHGAKERAAASYTQHDLRGGGPLALVSRVYDIAIAETLRAKTATEAGNWGDKGRAVQRSGRALALLQGALDREQGGQVAANLDQLYSYLFRRLSEAHVQNDPQGFEEIYCHLKELGAAWRTLARGESDPAAAAAHAAKTTEAAVAQTARP